MVHPRFHTGLLQPRGMDFADHPANVGALRGGVIDELLHGGMKAVLGIEVGGLGQQALSEAVRHRSVVVNDRVAEDGLLYPWFLYLGDALRAVFSSWLRAKDLYVRE